MKQPISILPAIALRGTTILPDMIVHFDVSRERSIKAIEAAMLHDQKIFLVTQKDPEVEKPELSELYQVGTVAYIKQVVKLPHDLLRVLVEGIERAELLGLEQEEPFLKAETALFEPDGARYTKSLKEAMFRSIQELFQRYCMESGKISKDLAAQIMNITELEELISQIAVNVPLTYQNKQKILEAVSLENQYEVLAAILNNEIEVLQIGHDLQRKLKARVDKNQRDYILREQLKLIREELGEENTADTAEEYRQKAEALDAPQEVKDKLNKEIDRFKSMNNAAAESSVLSTYIETLLGLPWDKKSEDSTDLKEAWKILEEGHYGLKDVKERIMEFLAVRKLTSGGKSPILCLVGPPGTGKTSIAKSVAEALHKKYVRICLGGVRDEAEIRGHRKTYVGAMPGRITAALSQAGVSNPLMLLDEIDKTSSDYKGDTSAALLEVLDPEQNNHFNDHYVEVPQDLSEVLFIATANDMDGIPRPLLDRMEVIEISGYTENEKEHIAKDHLIPKQLEVNGIPEGKLKIQTPALRKIITLYTREAGVRGLERKIGQICRKAAREIMENDQKKVTVNSKNLENYLGKARYSYLMANKKDEVGIARGLAWTQVGGDTLQIEVNVMPGKGELVLTGQLGDVMKESAQAGISYIRSVADKYGIAPEFFQENDIHVHIPEGAVPKDGPSAGITMATAMLSAIIGREVRADVAMTGEITLRGHVLPIGGLKEKLLAAKYAKIKQVLVPKDNKPDIQEMDAEILDGLKISFVDNMNEVLHEALA
ncbi:MAG: endopeptidase La [Blautia sp.]|uniref:endopeptidase La n=1 Tax=Blautia TaxID=572511 RepID=UPI00258D6F21|nr:endopeptidase La [Blautia sp.]MCI7289746.1 endopeptidase La [Blautia sp.]MDD7452255.1 endopeptidase La [Blautia obeum]MDY2754204.1 endopeptidase La [Blautia obeum]